MDGSPPRVGIGIDGHPFGPGAPLRLGGIEIPGAPALHGHSDGDAALHALADALLGAAGLGDLGRHHPADARTPRGVASVDLLASVVSMVRDVGWKPASTDLTSIAGRPHLGGHLDAIRAAIAGVLDVEVGAVSVKASTGNLSGDAAAGRGIAGHAVACLVPDEKRS